MMPLLSSLDLSYNSGLTGQLFLTSMPSSFQSLALSSSAIFVDLSSIPNLTSLAAVGNVGDFQLQTIRSAPNLVSVDLSRSRVNSRLPDTLGSGLMGGALTQSILSHLGQTNPFIQNLNLQNASLLDFGTVDSTSGSNLPMIVSPTLQSLNLHNLVQLRCSLMVGASLNWLAGMPALQDLDVSSLPAVYLAVASLAPVSSSIQTVMGDQTHWVGDLSALPVMGQLQTLSLLDSNLLSILPPHVSAVWPSLQLLNLKGCRIKGSLPTFAQLPFVQKLYLSGNNIEGPLSSGLFFNSSMLSEVYLESNRLTGDFPVGVVCPSLSILFLADNALTGPLPQWSMASLSTLSLAANLFSGTWPMGWGLSMPNLYALDWSINHVGGSLPQDFWLQLPNINALDGRSEEGWQRDGAKCCSPISFLFAVLLRSLCSFSCSVSIIWLAPFHLLLPSTK
jgi:Leucine-rich repeat (LRR) protein